MNRVLVGLLAACVSLGSAAAVKPPRSPTFHGSSATIATVEVGPGRYVPQSVGVSGGEWFGRAEYAAVLRGAPAIFDAVGRGSVGQLAKAVGVVARASGPTVLVGLAAAWFADQVSQGVGSELYPWAWDDSLNEWGIWDENYPQIAYQASTDNAGCPAPIGFIKGSKSEVALAFCQAGVACHAGWEYVSHSFPFASQPNALRCTDRHVSSNVTSYWSWGTTTLTVIATCAVGYGYNKDTGLCVPQSTTFRPVPPPTMDQAIEDAINGDPSLGPDMFETADGGPDFIPDADPADPQYGGPDAITTDQGTETTTGPDGVTTVDKSTEHQFDYSEPGSITVRDVTTRTETKPDGTTSTTTSTETGSATTAPPPGGGGSSTPPPPPNPCELNPNASGCAPLDEPAPESLAAADVSAQMSITSQNGSCPADIALDMGGTTHQLSWQPVCDFATGVRPVVIAMGALSAGLWVLFMFRKA